MLHEVWERCLQCASLWKPLSLALTLHTHVHLQPAIAQALTVCSELLMTIGGDAGSEVEAGVRVGDVFALMVGAGAPPGGVALCIGVPYLPGCALDCTWTVVSLILSQFAYAFPTSTAHTLTRTLPIMICTPHSLSHLTATDRVLVRAAQLAGGVQAD